MNQTEDIFLGVDGGQSHTEALVADSSGRIFGRGTAGPSNHAEQPGGRERLRSAVAGSVAEALGIAPDDVPRLRFRAAHFGMTGGADYKQEIIAAVIKADHLTVGHDSPTALASGTCGQPGIVVIAGTGSVVYGENARGENARAGGLGYVFSDEGSAFWFAARAVRLAIRQQDGVLSGNDLVDAALGFFGYGSVRELTTDFYNERITRDQLAGFAARVTELAAGGHPRLQRLVAEGVADLAENVAAVARRLGFDRDFPVCGVGGMFRGEYFRSEFVDALERKLPSAEFFVPTMSPAAGALILAYRAAGIELSARLLHNLETSDT